MSNSYVAVLPNPTDDWVTKCPFKDQTLDFSETHDEEVNLAVAGLILEEAGPIGEFEIENDGYLHIKNLPPDYIVENETALTYPPMDRVINGCYLIGASPESDWDGHDWEIVYWRGNEWEFIDLVAGQTVRTTDGKIWECSVPGSSLTDITNPGTIKIEYRHTVGEVQTDELVGYITANREEIDYRIPISGTSGSLRFSNDTNTGWYRWKMLIYFEAGFIMGEVDELDEDETKFKLISTAVTDWGTISSGIDVFKEATNLKSKRNFEGFGCVAKATEMQLSVVEDIIDNLAYLYNRKIIFFDSATVTYAAALLAGDDFYTGFIFGVNRSSPVKTNLQCRSILSKMDFDIGETFNSDNEKYKNLITPILYGNFEDSNGGFPLLVNKKDANRPSLVIESKNIKSILNVFCPDASRQEKYNVASLADFDFTGKELNLTGSDLGITVVSDGFDNYIVVKGECELDGGSPDEDTALLQYEGSTESKYGSEATFLSAGMMGPIPKEMVIRIDDEYMLLKDAPYRYADGGICKSQLFIQRGYYGSKQVNHDADAIVYVLSDSGTSLSLTCQHDFFVKGFAGVHVSRDLVRHDALPWANNYLDARPHFGVARSNWTGTDYNGTLTNFYDLFKTDPTKLVIEHYVEDNFSGHWYSYIIDLLFGDIGVSGKVEKMWLLGYYRVRLYPEPVWNLCELVLRTGGFTHSIGRNDAVGWNGVDKHIVGEYHSGVDPWSHPLFNNIDARYSTVDQNKTDFLVGENNGKLWLGDTISGDYDNGMIGDISELKDQRFSFEWLPGIPISTDEDQSAWLEISKPGFMVRFKIDPEKFTFYASGSGRVFQSGTTYFRGAGDGTTLIENPVEIIESILRDECDLTDNDLDETSFEASTDSRSSWKCSYLLTKSKRISEILMDICQESGLILYETRNGKLGVATLDIPSDTTGLTEVLNSQLVIDKNGDLKYSERYSNLYSIFSRMIMEYQRKTYLGEDAPFGGLTDTDDLSSPVPTYKSEAEDLLGQEKKIWGKLDCHRDGSTVNLFLRNIMQRYYKINRFISLEFTWDCRTLTVGQKIHFESGTKVPKTIHNGIYLITQNKINPEGRTVSVELLELIYDYEDLLSFQEVYSEPDRQYAEVIDASDTGFQEIV